MKDVRTDHLDVKTNIRSAMTFGSGVGGTSFFSRGISAIVSLSMVVDCARAGITSLVVIVSCPPACVNLHALLARFVIICRRIDAMGWAVTA